MVARAGSIEQHATRTAYANLMRTSVNETVNEMRAGADALFAMIEQFSRSRDAVDAEAIGCQAHGIERAARRARTAAVMEGSDNG